MGKGWKLTSYYLASVASGRLTWGLRAPEGMERLDVNGNTAESLLRAKKIEALPNEYPCSQSTEYKLIEGAK